MKLISLNTVAKIVGCTRQEVHRKMLDAKRNIPYIRIGREYAIDVKHVDKFKKRVVKRSTKPRNKK